MPQFAAYSVTREGRRQRLVVSASYGACVHAAQEAFQKGARGAWVETDGADDPVIKYKIGEVPNAL